MVESVVVLAFVDVVVEVVDPGLGVFGDVLLDLLVAEGFDGEHLIGDVFQ